MSANNPGTTTLSGPTGREIRGVQHIAVRKTGGRAIERVWAVVVYELLWDLRKWRTYIVVPLVLLAALAVGYGYGLFGSGYAKPTWWETTVSFVDTGLISGIFPLMIGAFLASDALATEFDKGIAQTLFAQPIRRGEIYFGKILEKGILLLILSSITVLVAAGAAEASVGGQIQLGWAPAFVLLLTLVFLNFAAIAFFFGSFLRSGTLVIGATLGAYFGATIAVIVAIFTVGMGYWLYAVPMVSSDPLIGALQSIIVSPSGSTVLTSSVGPLGSHRFTVPNLANFLYALVSVLAESATFLGLGYLLYRRSEVKG